MSNSVSCQISDELLAKIKKFRFAKNLGDCAILSRRKAHAVELEEENLQTTFEEVAEELPEDSPRFVLLSYKQELKDGRVKYPLVFLHYCPPGVSTELNMLYATTRGTLLSQSGVNRVIELQDPEEFTKEWADNNLAI